MRARKLFIGRNIRRIREETELTQAGFAKQLGISTSYLNQIENNQRHVTAPVLLALAENFSVDIASLSENDSDRLLADMVEAIADPHFKGQQPSAQDLKLVTQNTPSVARAFLAMHQALRRAGEQLAELDDTLERSGGLNEPTPYEEVRDFFHYIDNYVHELDIAAEQLALDLQGSTRNRVRTLADHLERHHRVRVAMGGAATAPGTIRRFDPVSRVLSVNPRTEPSTHAFQLAHQIGLLEHADTISAIIENAQFRTLDAAAVCRIGLANYFAGSTLLPYGPFLSAAGELRHDLQLLADRFGASIEQVAHRLSTLQRPGNKGIPFFFARVDQAGNITKRHSATKLQFARFGSACPLWNVHNAFAASTGVLRQLAETPDGVRYLCLATAISKPSGGFRDPVQRYALAFGCEIRHAGALVYADDLDLASDQAFEPIGISCRICERTDCHQRAVPPLKRKLTVDPNSRDTIPYSFD
ncbi:helix-turn-helix domain-containing protein [Hoeflea prorocentri]|uniref:Short-chain fatty acyl-CoA regulator family protein n=1 Tax=Hoeflea prorocentri TaxID=1922333 RepID=A0A9X3UJV2_9HYPH|nr:helix-turn-helix transcriptional regulator [Hoeflea prorocentri]MCY6380136.1 short-chain fatty acyl-CoA regulator family protein [Hoeflea prorocentri]MDA5397936.1 short-chain fatty acyl-CoA regulator family protein [Hoeflea prorocentri]